MGMSAAHCQGISECLDSGHPVCIFQWIFTKLLPAVNLEIKMS